MLASAGSLAKSVAGSGSPFEGVWTFCFGGDASHASTTGRKVEKGRSYPGRNVLVPGSSELWSLTKGG